MAWPMRFSLSPPPYSLEVSMKVNGPSKTRRMVATAVSVSTS